MQDRWSMESGWSQLLGVWILGLGGWWFCHNAAEMMHGDIKRGTNKEHWFLEGHFQFFEGGGKVFKFHVDGAKNVCADAQTSQV